MNARRGSSCSATAVPLEKKPLPQTSIAANWISGVLLCAMVLSWSSGFIGYRYVSQHSGVMVATFWRFVLAALLLLPLVWGPLRGLSWRRWLPQGVVGLLGIAGYIAPIAQSIALGVAPGTSSLLANLLPLSIVLLAGFVPGQATRGWQWLGVALCLVVCCLPVAAVWSFPEHQSGRTCCRYLGSCRWRWRRFIRNSRGIHPFRRCRLYSFRCVRRCRCSPCWGGRKVACNR